MIVKEQARVSRMASEMTALTGRSDAVVQRGLRRIYGLSQLGTTYRPEELYAVWKARAMTRRWGSAKRRPITGADLAPLRNAAVVVSEA